MTADNATPDVYVYRVNDTAACRCAKRCYPGLGDNTPHRTGYYLAYQIDEKGRQIGPVVRRWLKADAVHVAHLGA